MDIYAYQRPKARAEAILLSRGQDEGSENLTDLENERRAQIELLEKEKL